jgi:hypothetical protein
MPKRRKSCDLRCLSPAYREAQSLRLAEITASAEHPTFVGSSVVLPPACVRAQLGTRTARSPGFSRQIDRRYWGTGLGRTSNRLKPGLHAFSAAGSLAHTRGKKESGACAEGLLPKSLCPAEV